MITINSHSQTLQVEVFSPAGPGYRGTVVVVHGSDGMGDPWAAMIREYATDLAGKGFTALIPHYFDKTGSTAGTQIFAEMPDKLHCWQEAVSDTVAYGSTQPGSRGQTIGLLGFSLGGHLVLKLRGTAKAVVAFFAPELRELGGIGPPDSATAQVQIHHGLADSLVPFTNAQSIETALKSEGLVPEMFSYQGAGHGFHGTDANNTAARNAAKARSLEFFEKTMV